VRTLTPMRKAPFLRILKADWFMSVHYILAQQKGRGWLPK